MTRSEEKMAEAIIAFHKQNRNVADLEGFQYWQSDKTIEGVTEGVYFKVVFDELIKRGLIYSIGDEYAYNTKLTEEGENFQTFDLERSRKAKERAVIERKDKADLGMKEFIFKHRYIPYIFSTVSLIGTIVSVTLSIKAYNYKKEEPLKEQTIPLKQVSPKSNSIHVADSLSRTVQK